MSTRLVNVDRQTPLLLPLDMRDWVPGDDRVHVVLEAMNLVGISVNVRGTESEQYPPLQLTKSRFA